MRVLWSVMLLLAACGDSSNNNGDGDAGTGEAILTVTPSSYDFGSIGAGRLSQFAKFIVQNTGNRSSGALNSQIVFTHASQFRIVGDGCKGGILAPGGSCEIQVQFRPDQLLGPKEARMLIDTAVGGEATIPLTGTTVPDTGPRFTTGSAQASFGDQAVNTVSQPFTFVITNPGITATGVIGIMLSGVNSNAYSVQTSCSAPLQPGGTCNVTVQFAPTITGILPVSILLTSDPGGTLTLSLTGNSIDTAIRGSLSTKNFGPIGAGTMSPWQSIMITNTGTHSSGIVTSSFTGPNASEFQIGANGCTINLQPGASCFIDVGFTPMTLGSKTATYQAVASNSFVTVALSGLSVLSGGGVIAASTMSLPFGNQMMGTASAAQTVTITNTGTTNTGTITIAKTGAGAAAFTTTTTCTTLVPTESCDVNVTFAPAAAGAAQATISVTATGSNTVDIGAQGTGI